jgi:branched-chain amino acid aminotransferase
MYLFIFLRNYAPTIAISSEAEKRGCQQVLWLFGEDHQLTEVGAMNLFTYWINEQGGKNFFVPQLGLASVLLHFE